MDFLKTKESFDWLGVRSVTTNHRSLIPVITESQLVAERQISVNQGGGQGINVDINLTPDENNRVCRFYLSFFGSRSLIQQVELMSLQRHLIYIEFTHFRC